jgi:hypothetical protein
VLGDGLGVARFEGPQLGSGGLVELAARDVVVDLGRTVTVGRDVVPVITPATIAFGAVREAGAVVTARGVATAAVVLPVVTTTRATVASAPVTLTAVTLTPVTTRGVAPTAIVLPVITTTAVALALTTRTPLTLPLITTVSTRGVATTAIVLPIVAGPAGGTARAVAAAPVTVARVAGRAASSVVGPTPGRRSGTVTLASRSSAGPAVAGSSVPTLVPGPVLE